jgi:hypothetical protein
VRRVVPVSRRGKLLAILCCLGVIVGAVVLGFTLRPTAPEPQAVTPAELRALVTRGVISRAQAKALVRSMAQFRKELPALQARLRKETPALTDF